MLALILLGAVLLALIAVLLFPWAAGARLAGYCAQEGRYRYDRARVSALYPRLRTGDILLFTARASLIPIATGSQFNHAAMVVRRPGPGCGARAANGMVRLSPPARSPQAAADPRLIVALAAKL